MMVDTAAQAVATGEPDPESRSLFAIGQSTRTLAEFVALLTQVDVALPVDVRSIPCSRAVLPFTFAVLPESLAAKGIGYQLMLSLGGRRHHPSRRPPSGDTFWRVLAFRNDGDYRRRTRFAPDSTSYSRLTANIGGRSSAPKRRDGAVIAATLPTTCWSAAFRSST